MKRGLIYIHGKGGSAEEAAHYQTLFPKWDVVGMDYRAQTPWDAQIEFGQFFDIFHAEHDRIILVANSIGAYLSMNALRNKPIEQAYFISPIVNMEQLILDMMQGAKVTEPELQARGTIETAFGETLSWKYLSWVREHPLAWRVPTAILYGGKDFLQSRDVIQAFAGQNGATVTVMETGEHWFHTEEQMRFLDNWICRESPPGM